MDIYLIFKFLRSPRDHLAWRRVLPSLSRVVADAQDNKDGSRNDNQWQRSEGALLSRPARNKRVGDRRGRRTGFRIGAEYRHLVLWRGVPLSANQ